MSRYNVCKGDEPMAEKPLKIKKRGEDDHRILSIRVRKELLDKLDKLSFECNCSRNELINILLEHGVDNVEIED